MSCSRACLEKNCYLLTFLLLPFLNDKWDSTLSYYAFSLLFLDWFLLTVHVFAACSSSDNCNTPLVCVCFSVCVEGFRWTDYREICRMLYASLEHMAMWDNVCEKGTTVSSYCKTHRHAHMARQNENIMFEKEIGGKSFKLTIFPNI